MRKPIMGGMAALAMLAVGPVAAQEYFGQFSGNVVAEWNDDGETMTLLEPFVYTDPNGVEWTARAGSVVDGASIPRILWNIVGSPFNGRYRAASVIHDIACEDRNRTWEVSHLAFYYGMRAGGVSELQASIMYSGVYHLGPRWSLSTPDYDEGESEMADDPTGGGYAPWPSDDFVEAFDEDRLSYDEFLQLVDQIEDGSIETLEEIRSFSP